MDQESTPENLKKERRVGGFYLFLFLVLIFAGIYVKRIMGHPEFMAMFHLPAAVFLVLGGQKIMANNRRRYKRQYSQLKKSKV